MESASTASGPGPPPDPRYGDPYEVDPEYRAIRQTAYRIDDDAVRVARLRNAVELALGETLDDLSRGDRLAQLGYSKLSDYARERLGVRPRSMFLFLRLARGLRDRPFLRRAVLADRVSTRKARAILPVAFGDEEERWTCAAMQATVAELEVALQSEGREPPERFESETLWLRMTPAQQDRLDRGIEVAREVEDPAAARWRCVEMMCMEWIGTMGAWVPEEEPAAPAPCERPSREALLRQLDAAEEAVSLLERPGPSPDPVRLADPGGDAGAPRDAASLDARAKRLVAAHWGFDDAFGPLAKEIVDWHVPWHLGYRSLDEYARDRLGMSARALRERAWLEVRLCSLPELRAALSSGRLSYSKTLLLARDATPEDVAARIADAATTTCQQVERDTNAAEDRRNRAAGVRRLWGPKDAAQVMADAIAAAQEWSLRVRGIRIDAGEALAGIADHFVEVWEPFLKERRMPGSTRAILWRHGGLCAAPGCTRAACHRHHVRYRSRGGGHEAWNLLGVCAIHHHRCIHRGFVRVVGEAGQRLVWEFGTGEIAPLETWVTRGDDDVRHADAPAHPRPHARPGAARPQEPEPQLEEALA